VEFLNDWEQRFSDQGDLRFAECTEFVCVLVQWTPITKLERRREQVKIAMLVLVDPALRAQVRVLDCVHTSHVNLVLAEWGWGIRAFWSVLRNIFDSFLLRRVEFGLIKVGDHHLFLLLLAVRAEVDLYLAAVAIRSLRFKLKYFQKLCHIVQNDLIQAKQLWNEVGLGAQTGLILEAWVLNTISFITARINSVSH
jgi:hypothetical protein